MGKISQASSKYIVHATIEIEGIVDRPDVIGAIFGQTEGLLGSELELRELQRSGRIGRIEVNVDTKTGKALNGDMPWWNLPETMRAAAHCIALMNSPEAQQPFIEILQLSSDAYLKNFLNTNNSLFPYQTRCGKTGDVLLVTPAVPEGDPLYHTNLALIDMIDVLKTLAN